MPAREQFAADFKSLGSAKITISTATTTNFDFGTPDDLYLPNVANFRSGNRVLVVFRATTAGTTNTVSFSVQDAPDAAGSIGTPAAALTDGVLTGGTGDQYAITSVRLQDGRPWLRARVTSTGATDTFIASVAVWAVPGLL